MKKFWILSLTFIAALAAAYSLPSSTAGSERKFLRAESPIAGRYIVVLDESAGRGAEVIPFNAASELTAEYGGTPERVYETAFKGFSVEMTAKQAEQLLKDERVKYVSEDGEIRVSNSQTGATWGLDRIDQRELPLNSIYTYGTTGHGVNVYIIDTGIRTTHTDFGGRAVNAYDSVIDGQNGVDCNGHGTHVAGTIGGAAYGVAKNVNLFGIRVLGCNGLGTLSTVLAGVDWVEANHVKPALVNMSMGGGASDLLDIVVEQSIAEGITYIAAAGNSNIDACGVSPARSPNVITVGASNRLDERWESSNWGSCLDLFAPGVDISSTSFSGDTMFRSMNGTSMAAPHVTGTAALYLQQYPFASPADVAAFLQSQATVGKISNIDPSSPNRLLLSQPLAPTAGDAEIIGRVVRPDGRGLTHIHVVLSNANTGEVKTSLSNSFGYFKFEGLEVGHFYVMHIENKRYVFENNPLGVVLVGNLSDIVFAGTPRQTVFGASN